MSFGDLVVSPAPETATSLDPVGATRRGTIRRLFAIQEARVGFGLFFFMVLFIVVGPLVAPYGPNDVGVGIPGAGPSSANWLGTDLLGRDVLSRLLAGGESILLPPLIAIAIAFVISAAVGLAAGYLAGWVDGIAMRCLDVLLAIPPFLVVLVILAGFGTGTSVLIIAIVVIYVPSMTRVIRAATQAVAPLEYVQAARARGDSLRWILGSEILPNIMPTVLVELAVRLTFAIALTASLSFLGLGIQPPSPNWGVMVSENQGLLFVHPWACLAPAIAIGLLAISIHLVADALTQFFGGRAMRMDGI